MFHAHMSTEHFEWDAFGETELLARAALADGFNRHLAQIPDVDQKVWTPMEMDEYYGVVVNRVSVGQCFRDHSFAV